MPDPTCRPRKHHTLAEKQALVEEITRRVKAEGRGVGPIAKELGIAAATYYVWMRAGIRPTPPAVALTPHERATPLVTTVATEVDPRERARIIAAIRAGLAEGTPAKVTAKRHGITEGTFYRWVREGAKKPARRPSRVREESRALVVVQQQAPAFRPVILAAPEPAASLVLVAPSGHRVEGLDVVAAAALLRALSC